MSTSTTAPRVYLPLPAREIKGELSKQAKAIRDQIDLYYELREQEKKVKSRLHTCKGAITGICNVVMDKKIEKDGEPPKGPITFTHVGERTIDYVMSDKSRTNALSSEAMVLLQAQLSDTKYKEITCKKTSHKFDSKIMKEKTESGRTVEEVVYEHLQEFINESEEFSMVQRANMLKVEEKTHAIPDLLKNVKKIFPRMKQPGITQLFKTLSTQLPRYLHK